VQQQFIETIAIGRCMANNNMGLQASAFIKMGSELMQEHPIRWSLKAFFLTAVAWNAIAQTTPDAGSLLRETERQQRQLHQPAPQAPPLTRLSRGAGEVSDIRPELADFAHLSASPGPAGQLAHLRRL